MKTATAKQQAKIFRPTPALGRVSGKRLLRLKSEAPETLRSPSAKEFTSPQAYREAARKYKKYGNWSSDK